MTDPLARSREDLRAAVHLHDGGFHAQAVSRSYYAAFYAAEAALAVVGETRSKHSGVAAAFGKLDGLGEAASLLRSLFRRRGEADYEPVLVPAEVSEVAIADAEAVVEAVAGWLARQR